MNEGEKYTKMTKVNVRSSHPKIFCNNIVLKNFAKFTGKHLCQNLFFNKVSGLQEHQKWLLFKCEKVYVNISCNSLALDFLTNELLNICFWLNLKELFCCHFLKT